MRTRCPGGSVLGRAVVTVPPWFRSEQVGYIGSIKHGVSWADADGLPARSTGGEGRSDWPQPPPAANPAAGSLRAMRVQELEEICPLLADLNRMGCRAGECRWWVQDEEAAPEGECALALLALSAAKTSGVRSTRPANIKTDKARAKARTSWEAIKSTLPPST
jgi:hypothetical protein